ncbi:MAG TPA: DUF433 domain-containing protein [Allosphingosinicella sp.]|jgi:uncharacterized protein (DUF433 family)
MTEIDSVTVQEAQFLVGRPAVEINRVIDRGEVDKRLVVVVVEPAKAKKASPPRGLRRSRKRTGTVHRMASPRTVTQKVRKLGPNELVYLALGPDVHESFTPSARKKLYAAIKARPPGADKVSIGAVDVVLKPAMVKVMKRYRALRDVHIGIDERTGGEPVFRGTDIPVHMIAALAEGQGVDETLADYPSLKRRQVLRALDYASAYPKKGRPYPARSSKRAIAKLSAAGIFEVDDAAPPLRPEDFR